MVIYKTTNKINGKIYVGQDQKNNPKYLGSGFILKKALKKYGRDNFIKETLEVCSSKLQLDEREKYWIAFLHATDKSIGYNVATGGGGGNRLGAELKMSTREKISINKTGTHWGHHKASTKKKISELKLGIPLTNEHKKHLSEAWELREPTKPETLEKMRNSMLGKNTKFRYTLTSPTGKKYTIERGLKSFCKEHGIAKRNLMTRGYSKDWKIVKKETLLCQS